MEAARASGTSAGLSMKLHVVGFEKRAIFKREMEVIVAYDTREF
jgi:hypothetical protein